MKIKTPVLLILLFVTFNSFSQKRTEDFQLSIPQEKISGSLYDSITLIDKRYDTTTLGVVQKGVFNAKAKVIAVPQLGVQFSNFLYNVKDSAAKKGELVLLLQALSFAEVTGTTKEVGYFYMRAALFARNPDGYRQLSTIDTVAMVHSMDVTKGLLKSGNKIISNFIERSLTISSSEQRLVSLNNIANYDSIQKINLPLYNTTEYKNGAYKSFESFVKQQPEDTAIRIDFYKGSDHWKSIRLKNKHDKFEEIDLKKWYAFVYQNKIFISTDADVYPVRKKGNDFYFKGKGTASATMGNMLTAGFFFGILGVLAMPSGSTQIMELKIDYKSGGFMAPWQN